MPYRSTSQRALAILAVFVSVALLTRPATALGVHKDERLGFQIQIPKGWNEAPLQTGEQWIVAKYVSRKSEFWTDPSLGYTFEFQPELRVIAFIDELIKKSDFDDFDYDKDEDEDEEEDDKPERGVRLRTKIYRDYEDYLKGTLKEGFYIDNDTEKQVAGMTVRCLDVKIESAARHVVTYIFETDLAKVAVEFDFFEHQLKKERSTMDRTFRSFKTIERTISLNLDEVGTFISLSNLRSKTPEERAEYRKLEQDRTWERMTSTMPEGWSTEEIDGVRILSCVDSRYNKRMAGRIRAIYKWLDKTFPDLAPDEYVRYPLLRICKDFDSVAKFVNVKAKTGRVRTLTFTTEFITYKDPGGAIGGESRNVNRAVLRRWIQDRNPMVRLGLPAWLNSGLTGTLSSATVKGTKMKHGPSDWEREWLRRATRGETALSIKDLMMLTDKEYDAAGQDRDFSLWAQSVALARFMTVGAGSKGKTKAAMRDYVGNLESVLSEIEEEEKAERDRKRKEKKAAEEEAEENDEEYSDEPKNEEEEEALIKERADAIKAKERRILEETFQRTFGSWSARDWTSFENAYAKAIK